MQAKQIVVFVLVLLAAVGLAAFVAAAGGARWGTEGYGLLMVIGVVIGAIAGFLLADEVRHAG